MTRTRPAHSPMVLPRPLEFRKGCLNWSRPYVMGVLNLTPDSFSDGGRLPSLQIAVDEAMRMVDAGADIIDIGGESTRPGASPVSADQECARIVPLIEALAAVLDLPISVDTSKAAVALRAVEAGAQIVNDVSGGLFDSAMLDTLASLQCAFVCGHVRGKNLAEAHAAPSPEARQVREELSARIAALPQALRSRTIADPCVGFGKDLATNLGLLAQCAELRRQSDCAVLIGASRKRFLGDITGLPVNQRDAASLGASLAAIEAGANIVRVHNVAMTVPAIQVYWSVGEAA